MLEAIAIGLVIFVVGLIPLALWLSNSEPSIEVIKEDEEDNDKQ